MIAFPAIPGEVVHDTVSSVVGTGWGMSANLEAGSKEEAAAWELIKFLVSEYVQICRLKNYSTVPTNSAASSKVTVNNGYEPFTVKKVEFHSNYSATPVIDDVLHQDIYDEINSVLTEIGLGTCTPNQGAERVQEAWLTWKANN